MVETILERLPGDGSVARADEPLRIALTCYEVLHAASDARGGQVLETAYATLQMQAARIPDEMTRRSFLENVPYHRELVAAWEAAQRQA